MEISDYYEFLQISPSAEADTVHRVYRFLAARFHPDNHDTGDAERFFLLKQAYEVLSNPERRAEYDATRQAAQPEPLSAWVDFMDNMEGELNRRLAFLTVLYFQRRTNPNKPEVSFRDIESRLGFPRDYLTFTAWYLRTKGYINPSGQLGVHNYGRGSGLCGNATREYPGSGQIADHWRGVLNRRRSGGIRHKLLPPRRRCP